jgi:hypothetical protein
MNNNKVEINPALTDISIKIIFETAKQLKKLNCHMDTIDAINIGKFPPESD